MSNPDVEITEGKNHFFLLHGRKESESEEIRDACIRLNRRKEERLYTDYVTIKRQSEKNEKGRKREGKKKKERKKKEGISVSVTQHHTYGDQERRLARA